MAIFFYASIECGANQNDADLVTDYFEELILTLPEGRSTSCWSETCQDEEGNWWCLVLPRGTNYGGYIPKKQLDGSLEHVSEELIFRTQEELKPIVDLLCEHLKMCPNYRYALVGYAPEFFRTISELFKVLNNMNYPGLIISEQLWREAGSPQLFVPFAKHYVWQTWKGAKHTLFGHKD